MSRAGSRLFRLRPATVLAAGAAIGGASYYLFDARSSIHEKVFCPIIRKVTDAEQGHLLGIWLMKTGLVPRLYEDHDDPVLKVNVFGKTLSNPIGCAAGLDKHGEAIDALFGCGFGYVEIGSITPVAQPGNPKPRFFRLSEDNAVINRYGFNSVGHDEVVERLQKRSEVSHDGKLFSINLGKNKTGDEVEDYTKGVEKFKDLSDVLVINISSPNTPGLRNLQSGDKLSKLLKAVVDKRDEVCAAKTPILVKIAPDLDESEIKSIVNTAIKCKINGIIVSNTTIQRPESLKSANKTETGGLSGEPVKPFSLKALKLARKYAKNSDLVLVGCGGISNGQDVVEFGRAGAKFVELYTSFAYKGPGLVYKIKQEVTDILKKEGKTWEQIVGEDDR